MFRPWPKNPFVRHLEGKGHTLRKRLGLGEFEALSPSQLIQTYDDMALLDLRTLSGQFAAEFGVLQKHSNSWSAFALREGGGPWLITWNPWHSENRVRASLMEEVSHIILKHRPTRLLPDPLTGLPRRVYAPSKEKEAYGVAGAALVPYNGLVALIQEGDRIPAIALRYGVSAELVQMRLNITRAADGALSG
jgi:hypothetical protein